MLQKLTRTSATEVTLQCHGGLVIRKLKPAAAGGVLAIMVELLLRFTAAGIPILVAAATALVGLRR